MKLVKPRELNLGGTRKVAIVDPASPLNEIMPIGHGCGSKTFLPKIVPDPNHTHGAYCDCPGFSDNRGPEINIANAINIKQILQRSAGVKAVFLINYDGLSVDRGKSIDTMEKMCLQMFGGIDNLEAYQNSVLLGITRAPLYEDDEPLTHDAVYSLLTVSPGRTIKILADRMFLFDPLDRGSDIPDFWSIERCRSEIARLKSIPQQEAIKLFQPVLTGDDRTKLLDIARQIREPLTNAIKKGDEAGLRHNWKALQRLRVIGHDEVEQLIDGEVLPTLGNEILKRIDECKEHAHAHNFERAEEQLDWLTRIQNILPEAPIELNIPALRQTLEHCRQSEGNEKVMKQAIEELTAQLEAAKKKVKIHFFSKITQGITQIIEGIGEGLDEAVDFCHRNSSSF